MTADPATGVASLLKLLSASRTNSAADRARVRRELRKQLGLTHPHVPRVFDEDELAGRVWFLRELVPGESLALRLRQARAAKSSVDALAVIAQLASALDGLHRQGLAHRDLKPSHVVFRSQPKGSDLVQLIDCGIASPLAGRGPRNVGSSSETQGTAGYVAPEVAGGASASFRSDLYSLGCVAYELLTGAAPAPAEPSNDATLPSEVSVPTAARALIASMLAKDPRRRPFSAQQVRRALDPFLPSWVPAAPVPARTVPPLPPSAALAASANRVRSNPPRQEATVELGPDELELAVDSSELEQISPNPSQNSDATEELDLVDVEPVAPVQSREPVTMLGAGKHSQRVRPQQATLRPSAMRSRTSSVPVSAAPARARSETAAPASLDEDDSAPTIALPHAQILDENSQPLRDLEVAQVPAELRDDAPIPSGHVHTEEAHVQAALEAQRAAHARELAATESRQPLQPSAAESASLQLSAAEAAAEPRRPRRSTQYGVGPSVPAAEQHVTRADATVPSHTAPVASGVEQASHAAPTDTPEHTHAMNETEQPSKPMPVHPGELAQPAQDADDDLVPPTAAQPGADEAVDETAATARFDERKRVSTSDTRLPSRPRLSRTSFSALDDTHLGPLPPEIDLALRSAQQPSLSQRPTILLWSVAALVLLAIALRLVRGQGPEQAGQAPLVALPTPVPQGELAAPLPAETALDRQADSEGHAEPTDNPDSVQPLAANGQPSAAPAAAPSQEPAAPPPSQEPSAPKPLTAAERAARSGRLPDDGTVPPAETIPAKAARGGKDKTAGTVSAAAASKGFAHESEAVPFRAGKPKSDVDYKAKGRQFYRERKFREAAEMYQSAVGQNGSDSGAYAGMGTSWLAAKEPEKAIAAYQRAVQLKPDNSAFQAALGRAYAAKGDKARAQAAYDKALAIDPNNETAKTEAANLKKR